jgi:MFS transporter, DHA1 family, tetracycline resistance protein
VAISPETEHSASDTVRRRVLNIVVFTVFLDLVGFGLVIPLLPLYVDSMNASKVMVGIILSCFSFAQFVATPILGRLSDVHGRRRIILFSLAGNAVSMIIFAVATQWGLLWMLFASRLLAGATAGNLSACQAAIADVTDRSERTKSMGRLGAGIGLGLVIGPVMGGVLSEVAPWAPPVAAAAMAVIDVVLTFFYMPETLRSRRSVPPVSSGATTAGATAGAAAAGLATPTPAVAEARPLPSLRSIISERKMAAVLILFFLTFMCMTNLQVALALLAKERMGWGSTEISYSFGLFGFCGLVIQGGLMGRLVKWLSEIYLVIIGAVLNAGGMLLIGFSRSSPMLIGGLVLLGIGIAVTNPSLSSLVSRLARDEQQGTVLGFAQSSGTFARIIGPTWSSILYDGINSTAPFVSGAVAALLSLLIGSSVKASITSESRRSPSAGAATDEPAKPAEPAPPK